MLSFLYVLFTLRLKTNVIQTFVILGGSLYKWNVKIYVLRNVFLSFQNHYK